LSIPVLYSVHLLTLSNRLYIRYWTAFFNQIFSTVHLLYSAATGSSAVHICMSSVIYSIAALCLATSVHTAYLQRTAYSVQRTAYSVQRTAYTVYTVYTVYNVQRLYNRCFTVHYTLDYHFLSSAVKICKKKNNKKKYYPRLHRQDSKERMQSNAEICTCTYLYIHLYILYILYYNTYILKSALGSASTPKVCVLKLKNKILTKSKNLRKKPL